MQGITTYWETLRHLRPVQFYGRAWFKFFRPPIDRTSAPQLSRHEGLWVNPILCRPSMEGPSQFRFLNHLHTLPNAGGWEEKGLERLWLYNLHYFDDLNAENFENRTQWHRDLINRWIVENKPGKGTGWEPYPTSLRIVNWIKWSLAGHSLDPKWVHNLAIQTRWLRRRMEWHLMGNHLLANAKALIFAGLFFKGTEADGWLKTGLKILNKQIAEQVLEDGGHFELSPMYHSIILEDVLDLLNISQTWPRKFPKAINQLCYDTAEKMLKWLVLLTHPDEEIAFFNDAAFEIAGSPRSLCEYARRLNRDIANRKNEPVCNLDSSGYIRLTLGDAVAFLDVAPIGPNYIPGHAHADTLSFEISLFGQRILVNSGTSLYEKGDERLRQRGTAAHNTVQIDRENSSEVWSSFRVAKRARAFGLQVSGEDRVMEVECSHDGYQRLPGRNIHKRCWRLSDHLFEITDKIDGRFESAVSRYHLHPDIHIDGNSKLRLPNGKSINFSGNGDLVSIRKATWHPEFGKEVETQCIEVDFQSSEVTMTFTWN